MSNVRISWMHRYRFYDLKAHFWWPNKRLFSYNQRWNTLYLVMCMANTCKMYIFLTSVPVFTVYICSEYVYFVAIFGMSLDNFDTCLNKKDLLHMYKVYKMKGFEFCALHSKPIYPSFYCYWKCMCEQEKKWALKIQCLCIKFTFNFISFDRRQTQSGAHIFGKHVSQLTPFSSYYLVWIVQSMVNTWCTISKWVPKKGQGNFEERCIYLVLSGL